MDVCSDQVMSMVLLGDVEVQELLLCGEFQGRPRIMWPEVNYL